MTQNCLSSGVWLDQADVFHAGAFLVVVEEEDTVL